MSDNNLESLYTEAKQALKAKDYDRASDLLRQILKVDEDYKDTSRLLAQSVRLKRRRWYNDSRMWGVLGFMVIAALGFFIAPRMRGLYVVQPSAPDTDSLTATLSPTAIATATATLLPVPTPVPLIWKRISIGQDFARDTVTAFATDKNDPDVIYAGMKNAGVYKTIDGGLSWRPAHQGLSNTQVESLLIDSQNPYILYAGTIGGVFKTEDGGENWHRIGDGAYLLMDIQNNSHLYARDENSVYETKDQGDTWKIVYTLGKDCPDKIHSWAIHPVDGNMIFTGGSEKCAGVYQSVNSGLSWTLMGTKDRPNIDDLALGMDEEGNFSIYTDCDVSTSDPENPTTVYCGSVSNLSVMQDNRNKWKIIPGTESMIYTALHIDHPNGIDRIIAGVIDVSHQSDPNVNLIISEDGGLSWVQRDNGLGATWAELKIDPMNNAKIYLAMYYVGTNEAAGCTLYRTLDSGKIWMPITSSWQSPSWCGPAFDGVNVIYLMDVGSLQKSWDGGETWLIEHKNRGHGEQTDAIVNAKAIANLLPDLDRGVSFQSVSANPYIDGNIYAVGDTIYYSPDTGVSWQPSTGSEGSWDARLFYTDQSKIIYAIGRYHQTYSTDNGKTWQSCVESVATSRSDSRLALDLLGSRLYLATPGRGVLISTDNCQSWQASNNGLNNLFVNTLAIDLNNSNTIYAGTDGGAYISYDAGATWGQVNDGLLGATVVYSIVVDKDSNVYVATPYGVFKLEGK